MLKQTTKRFVLPTARAFTTSKQHNFKVTVCGASGGIGQPLSLLLKLNPLVTELALYDVVHTPGVAADLSHIDTNSQVKGFLGPEKLKSALACSDVVVIPAGLPRKPGMTRDDLFLKNAGIVKEISTAIIKSCPKALIAIITNPLNSCLPIASVILKKANVYDPNRLFGIFTLDSVRARTFIGNSMGTDPRKINIPVIGGHSGITIVPLISQCKPEFKGDKETLKKLTVRIQEAGTEVVKAKAGAGSATLSMAHAGSRFINSLLRGLNGEKNVVECTYVESCVTDAAFFANPVVLGREGLEKNLGLPDLSKFECELLEKAMPELKKNIQKGIDYANGKIAEEKPAEKKAGDAKAPPAKKK